MIGAAEQRRGLLQQNAQEPIQLAQVVGRHAIPHAARPWADNIGLKRMPLHEGAARDEGGVSAG